MYTGKYIPKFPYTGEQVTIGSGRILVHAKDDSAFIFADKSIVLSTTGSLHVNATEGTFISSQTIELGLNAQEALIKGNTAVQDLKLLYNALQKFTVAVGGLSTSEPQTAIPKIISSAKVLDRTLARLKNRLPDLLSQVSKTQ